MLAPRLKCMFFIATIGLIVISVAGCPRVPPAPPAPPAPSVAPAPGGEVEGGPFAEGRKVFQSTGCTKCHSVGDQQAGGPKLKGSGPKLTTVGAKHPREWIVEHIRDPKTHNEKSRMPAYDTDKISDADMQSLADYLASLK